jgi:hypothetical protein
MVLVAPQAIRHEGQAEVLALLRQGSGSRPRFDPALAGGFRAWLEDAASLVVRSRGEDAPALHVGPRQLLGESGAGERKSGSSTAFMTACLVHALFRQIVITGSVDDPLGDATGALRVDPSLRDVVRQIDALTSTERRTLTAVLKEHVQQLRILTPRLQPGWLPRTDDPIAIPLAGGRVVLHGRFDLLIGTPSAGSTPDGTASLCAVGLTAEGPWAQARRKLHLLALLETIRSGTPPFRLALLHSGDGRYGVEDVLEEHLRAVVSLVATRLAEVARAPE